MVSEMVLDCNLKKNAKLKECKARVGEAHFTMILPKADNSGRKIKPSIHKKQINKVNKHFGGSTIKPITLGCWRDEERKKLQCESGYAVETFRDFDSDPKMKKLDAIERRKVLKKDHTKMKLIAKSVAKEYGQDSVPVIYDNITDVSLVKGEWKPKINRSKTGKKITGDVFNKNL